MNDDGGYIRISIYSKNSFKNRDSVDALNFRDPYNEACLPSLAFYTGMNVTLGSVC